ncbi:MAG: GTPase ObgE [Egibacteraceae bacterium]
MFIDEVKLHVKGGRGGDGVTAFLRQPYEPKGPPDGGDGGHGGSVVLEASGDVATLLDFHHRPHRAADRGRHGQGDRRRGADGKDERLLVPVGTVVKDALGAVLTDLAAEGATCVAASGGRGGRGNASLRTRTRRAPRFHELGEPGQERWLVLELKLLADVALVGFPNVGKSSLIARLSAARPKIADYPFTTLSPNLGVVAHDEETFVVADVPGLVPGAAEGRGLGRDFLRHIERASVLVHVLDCASYEQRDPREDLAALVAELRAYQDATELAGWAPLLDRPALVLLNKADADAETAEIVLPDLRNEGWEVIVGSVVTGQGMQQLRTRMADLVRLGRSRRTDAAPAAHRRVLRPVPAHQDFSVERTPGGFQVVGERIDRWVVMTDLSNDEGVAYLQSRLARGGVERALVLAGARLGDTIELGGYAFDFAPEPDDLEAVEPDSEPTAASSEPDTDHGEDR